jgi:mono/diheme cytochrome c family protein
MSAEPPIDPRQEPSAQTDESLRESHTEVSNSLLAFRLGLPVGLALVFAASAFIAGFYLDRYSGNFSATAYNEEAGGQGISAPKPVDPLVLGKKQFNSACVTCHQATGLGLPGTYPPLAGSEWVNGSEERLIRIVLHGLGGEVQVQGKTYNGAMPSFGKVPGSGYNWRDDQIAAVLSYVRQEWGNKAPAISTEKVAALRAQIQRSQPWTAAELQALP